MASSRRKNPRPLKLSWKQDVQHSPADSRLKTICSRRRNCIVPEYKWKADVEHPPFTILTESCCRRYHQNLQGFRKSLNSSVQKQHEVKISFPRKYVSHGPSVTNLWFFQSTEEYESDNNHPYKPKFCHQTYNDNEQINGYESLSIDILYNIHTMNACLLIRYSETIDEVPHFKRKADDIEKMLSPWLPPDFDTERTVFLTKLENRKQKMYGRTVVDFSKLNNDGELCKYSVNLICPEQEEGFNDFHDRFQKMAVWYIETASLVDIKVPRWEVFYLYETKNNISSPVGFCTTYNFYMYDKTVRMLRTKIGQFFILPSHQRNELGTKLLQVVYQVTQHKKTVFHKHFYEKDCWTVYDFAVEHPSEGFQRMRDVLDCRLLRRVPQFQEDYVLKYPFTKDCCRVARNRYKLYYNQVHRVYEILNLYYAGTNLEYLRCWCDRVRWRLMKPYVKEVIHCNKFKLKIYYTELAKATKHREPFKTVTKQFRQYCHELIPTIQKLKTFYKDEEEKALVQNTQALIKIWDEWKPRLVNVKNNNSKPLFSFNYFLKRK